MKTKREAPEGMLFDQHEGLEGREEMAAGRCLHGEREDDCCIACTEQDCPGGGNCHCTAVAKSDPLLDHLQDNFA